MICLVSLQELHEKSKLAVRSEDMKTLKEHMHETINFVCKKAHAVKAKLDGLDQQNSAAQRQVRNTLNKRWYSNLGWTVLFRHYRIPAEVLLSCIFSLSSRIRLYLFLTKTVR